MVVYRVVFYKSLIFKTSKNKFYPTFQFAIFLNTIIEARLQNSRFFLKIGEPIEAAWILVSYERS